MDVIVVFQRLEKFANSRLLFARQFREVFGNVPQFARDHGPSIGRGPVRDCMEVAVFGDKPVAGRSLWNIVVLGRGKRFDILRAGFDRRRFNIRGGIGVMGFDQADVIEKELVAAGRAELTAFLEEHANLWRGAVVVVGQDLDDNRHLVRGVALENDMFHDELVVADARAFLDRALDHIARDAGFARLIDDGGEPGIPGRLSSAELRGDHNFFDKFSDDLAFFQPGDFSFGMQPLATHTADVSVGRRIYKERWFATAASRRGAFQTALISTAVWRPPKGRARRCRAVDRVPASSFGSTESRPTEIRRSNRETGRALPCPRHRWRRAQYRSRRNRDRP